MCLESRGLSYERILLPSLPQRRSVSSPSRWVRCLRAATFLCTKWFQAVHLMASCKKCISAHQLKIEADEKKSAADELMKRLAKMQPGRKTNRNTKPLANVSNLFECDLDGLALDHNRLSLA